MEGHQTAKWGDGTRAITTCYPSIPWGDQILTEQMSYHVYWFSFAAQPMIGDTVTLFIHICCWLIWILTGPISGPATKVWARSAYLTARSSDGTTEEREPLAGASSCSPGPAVTRTLFDVGHLHGLALIVSASGTPWPTPHTTHR